MFHFFQILIWIICIVWIGIKSNLSLFELFVSFLVRIQIVQYMFSAFFNFRKDLDQINLGSKFYYNICEIGNKSWYIIGCFLRILLSLLDLIWYEYLKNLTTSEKKIHLFGLSFMYLRQLIYKKCVGLITPIHNRFRIPKGSLTPIGISRYNNSNNNIIKYKKWHIFWL